MTEYEARLLMGEIHRISMYRQLEKEYAGELKRLDQEKADLYSIPSSGNFDKVKAENNHVETSTRLIIILSDEQAYIDRLSKIRERLSLAISYREQVIAQTANDPFMIDYMDGMTYKKLSYKYGWENPYEHMKSVMKGLSISV